MSGAESSSAYTVHVASTPLALFDGHPRVASYSFPFAISPMFRFPAMPALGVSPNWNVADTGLGDGDGDGDGDGVALGLVVGEGDGEGVGDGVPNVRGLVTVNSTTSYVTPAAEPTKFCPVRLGNVTVVPLIVPGAEKMFQFVCWLAVGS